MWYSGFSEWERYPVPLAVKKKQEQLTAIVSPDDGQFTAICPELDLAVAGTTVDEAFDELVSAAKDYAKEYLAEEKVYAKSPNRAHHLGFVRRIASADEDELRRLFTA